MLTERDKSLLQHIIKHCLKIETKIEGITLDIFIANEDLREIICFNLIQIGELAKNVSQELITKYSDMPWSQIKGLMDRIAHGYGSIDTTRIWNTASNDVAPLRKYCEAIMGYEN